MLNSFDHIQYLLGNSNIIANMEDASADTPFNEQTISYLDNVSKQLLRNPEAKSYPDVITFGFWCRKASILGYKKTYKEIKNRLGRGVVFHIAPSNVPVNFAYSLVAGLLAGNSNIVRVPSKDFKQVELVCNVLDKAMDDNMRKRVCLVRYGHNKKVTDAFSILCDTRIIWGGDQTIATIRKSPMKPRATEIAFADRYSICLIDADKYLIADNKTKIASDFYNDTYLTDQNACTSPKLIVWIGGKVDNARDIFWEELYQYAQSKYILQPIQAINKYTNFCRQAIKNDISLEKDKDNLIVRVIAKSLNKTLINDNGNSGYFIEYEAKSINELLPVCDLECQTLAYYGVEKEHISSFIMEQKPKGIDRVVPVGKTMDFDLEWDGIDLISSLSREICWI